MAGEVAAAGPFFAEIHELEKQAEGVRNLVSLLDTEMVDGRGARVQAGGGVGLSRSDGKVANPVELAKNTLSGLFANDRVQSAGQKPDFLS
jgi:hypothetical protein